MPSIINYNGHKEGGWRSGDYRGNPILVPGRGVGGRELPPSHSGTPGASAYPVTGQRRALLNAGFV